MSTMSVSLRSFANSLDPNIAMFQGPLDERPLGDENTVMMMAGVYLLSLSLVKATAYGTKATGVIRVVSVVNNFVMCLYSLYTLVGVCAVLMANWMDMGYDTWLPMCDTEKRMMRGLDFWMYHFFLSKFWEWIDTWILILKGKDVWPPSNSQFFLHVFHHTTTASIAWLAWRGEFAIAWIGPLTNSFVHTPMYAYYFLTDFWPGARRYGIFITPIQIFQFILCLSALVPSVLSPARCGGTVRGVAWMVMTYSVFLTLFVKMFANKKKARSKRE